MRGTRRALALAALLPLIACSGERKQAVDSKPVASPAPVAAPAPQPQALPTVVFLGDSLTAGLGLEENEAYPALVGEALAAKGLAVRVVNAGVSGDTTAGGLARLDWLLTQKPAVVFVALGANDGLRAQPIDSIESTLREILVRA